MSLSANEYWAFRSLAADGATAELSRAFRDARVTWLLLKGPAVARRLYTDGTPRPYVDVDALIAPNDYATAEEVLTTLGYVAEPYSSRQWAEHDSPWRRPGGSAIDLHRGYTHVPAAPAATWAALSRDAESLRVADEEVRVPGRAALALIIALHALHDAPAKEKAFTDLQRACGQESHETWVQAKRIAQELGATSNLAAALSLVPGSASIADAIGLARPSRFEVSLRSGDRASLAARLANLQRGRGLRAKARVIYRELAPDSGFAASAREEPRRPRRLRHALTKLPIGLAAWWVQRKDFREVGDARARGTAGDGRADK